MQVMTPLLVFLGGGLGAVLRWSVGLLATGWWGPWVANVIGSFLLGVILASPIQEQRLVLFLATGVMGGFTTYSSFNAEVVDAISRGAWAQAALQLTLTLTACLGAGGLGLWLPTLWQR